MGVRDAGEPARLEYAGPGHDLDKSAVRITDAHEAAPTLPGPADEASQQHRRHRADEEPGEGIGDPF